MGCILAEFHLKNHQSCVSSLCDRTLKGHQKQPPPPLGHLLFIKAHSVSRNQVPEELRMQTPKASASPKTYIYISIQHCCSIFPVQVVPSLSFVRCAWLFFPAQSLSASSKLSPSSCPTREPCHLAHILARDAPLSALLSDSHEQFRSERCFSFIK